MVRLVGVRTMSPKPFQMLNFNSSMVRLVDLVGQQVGVVLLGFQFQYGAIGGLSEITGIALVLGFQFQYGAIGGNFA